MSEPSQEAKQVITTNEQAYRDGTLSQPSVIRRNPNEDHRAAQPSAPTAEPEYYMPPIEHKRGGQNAADVEKIARDAVSEWCLESRNWVGYDMPAHQQLRLLELFKNVAAQVCAPLVEALRRVRLVLWQDAAYPYDGKVIRDLDAALTGTGEWQQALDQQQQTNAEIVEKTTRK